MYHIENKKNKILVRLCERYYGHIFHTRVCNAYTYTSDGTCD